MVNFLRQAAAVFREAHKGSETGERSGCCVYHTDRRIFIIKHTVTRSCFINAETRGISNTPLCGY